MVKQGRLALLEPATGAGPNVVPYDEAETCFSERVQIPSVPEGDGPQLEAGYMHAVFSNTQSRALADSGEGER